MRNRQDDKIYGHPHLRRLCILFAVGFLAAILGMLAVSCGIQIPDFQDGYSAEQQEMQGNPPDNGPAAQDSGQKSESTCIAYPDSIPDYSGAEYITLQNGEPNFTEWELASISGETFSELDGLGRCGTAEAMLNRSMMPSEERGEIANITPTGWVQNKYEGIVDSDPPYLYNRCHLIAYALTGENANERNLITGTRYMNINGMLPWEEKVMQYLDSSPNHVLYRVTPFFRGDELLARGVEMEAYSVEDHGEGICFHVFIYNVQPGIELDYRTGHNRAMTVSRTLFCPNASGCGWDICGNTARNYFTRWRNAV